jgi:hypothetical protein
MLVSNYKNGVRRDLRPFSHINYHPTFFQLMS